MQVILLDEANRKPTDNPPGISKIFPPEVCPKGTRARREASLEVATPGSRPLTDCLAGSRRVHRHHLIGHQETEKQPNRGRDAAARCFSGDSPGSMGVNANLV
ncbi:MAG TPA: hypothetical protein VHW45_00720 [Candidatus Sulfotelmatobacter sp.]|jgi:hypothetical protein|nr:hypothetical protein [Candidatus Sulfotelmatobacter sp.]